MYTDSTGTLTWAPANLLTYSQDLTNAAWTKSNVSASQSGTSPDGTSTACLLAENATTNSHIAFELNPIAAGTTYISSVYLKKGNGATAPDIIQLSLSGTTFPATNYVNFNITTGVVTASSDISGSITDVGNGWYRCSVRATATSAATASGIIVGFVNNNSTATRWPSYLGVTTSNVYVWGAQLEPVTYQTSPRAYIPTTTAAVYQPRYDYDPSVVPAQPRGMLIEESRANVCVSVNSWTGGLANITRTTNAAISPDGAQNATKIEASVVTTTSFTQSITATGTGAHTYSIYAKVGTATNIGNRFLIRNSTTATNLVGIILNYGDGTFTYSAGSTGATTTYVGNGWWRISLTSSAITSGDLITVYAGFASAVTVTIGDYFYLYGSQVELGAFATSYIPTVASSVTRVADVVRWTSAAFSSYWNASAGSIIAEAIVPNTGGTTRRILAATDGGTSNAIQSGVPVSGISGYFEVRNSGVAELVGTSGAFAVGNVFRNAIAYKLNDYAFATNAGTVGIDTSCAVPTVNRVTLGYYDSGVYMNGYIRSFAYYNQRLPDAILKQKSTVGAPF
jgi:hypothetical protein